MGVEHYGASIPAMRACARMGLRYKLVRRENDLPGGFPDDADVAGAGRYGDWMWSSVMVSRL